MKFRDIINQTSLTEMKFEALSKAKQIHTELAKITFIEMMSLMNPDNPAKKEVQNLETELNVLTTKVGEFIQKYIPDIQNAEVVESQRDTFPKELVDKAQRYGISLQEIRKLNKVSQLERLIYKKIVELEKAYAKKEKEEGKSTSQLKAKFKSALNKGIKDAKWTMKHEIDDEDKGDAAYDLADVVIGDLKSQFGKDFDWIAKELNIRKDNIADSIYG